MGSDHQYSRRNYYDCDANLKNPSVSFIKMSERCEAMAMAIANGTYEQKKTTGMLQGTYGHSLMLDTHQEIESFKAENANIFYQKNGKKPYATFDVLHSCADALNNHEEIAQFINDCDKEQIIVYELFEDIYMRSMLDLILPDKSQIGDLKFLADIEPNQRTNWQQPIKAYGYDTQIFMYGYGVFKLYGKWPLMNIFVVEKSRKPKIQWFQFDYDNPVDRYHINLTLLNTIQSVKKLIPVWRGEIAPKPCLTCDYCNLSTHTDKITYSQVLTEQELKDYYADRTKNESA